ncbi:phosphatidylinositol 3,4,5-trisphosphate 3-phosphatase and protein-tyrosine-phosphatase PTEN1 [Populus alba x Populus x berolinensis]|nr:phosphatidylinositol 3,4,5-trisphosphate 3-phosphatase and protein-tyrosine-phosphatase PTEN1 [Populus alba x Populus x berolinensis]
MVCAYLVYSGMTPEDALQLYANKRTTNNQGVSIPSQRRYVGYWAEALSFPKRVYESHRGDGHAPPEVILPQSRIRELRRIRLYDMVNTESVFFVVSELQEIPGQLYRPSVEVAKSCLRPIIEGCQRNSSPQYYISFTEGNEEEEEALKPAESRLIVQMDTESPIIYQKTTLDYYFDEPIRVKGDVRVIFYQKMIGGRLFYVCFNTAFIRNGLLQFSTRDLDKVGTKGRSICGPAFCLELLFAPANSNHSGTLTEDVNGGGGGGGDDDDISNDCP